MVNKILNPYVKGLDDGARKDLHEMAERLRTPSVEPEVGMFLEFFCRSARPKRILEIGCGIGVSTAYMRRGAPDAEIIAVDHNAPRLAQARVTCPSAQFVQGEAREVMQGIEGGFDLIFIDSVKKEYPIIYYYAEKLLNEGGTIIIDDVFIYGHIFSEDCEIPDKFRPSAIVMREFLNRIKATRRHSLLPLGGGVALIGERI